MIINEHCCDKIPGVFAGGDAVNGGKEVVDAVQAGKGWSKSNTQIFGIYLSNKAAYLIEYLNH